MTGPVRIIPPTPEQIADNPDAPGSHEDNCKLKKESLTAPLAYHCRVSAIDLSGGSNLTIDTTNYPVYIYLQGASANIRVQGQSLIQHKKNGSDAPLLQSNDFQIRGVPTSNTTICNTGQNWNMGANGISSFFLWGPCASTTISGTATWGGILWTNNLSLNGTGLTNIAIPNNTGTCAEFPDAPPCKALIDAFDEDAVNDSKPIDWAARSINFTRFF